MWEEAEGWRAAEVLLGMMYIEGMRWRVGKEWCECAIADEDEVSADNIVAKSMQPLAICKHCHILSA